MFGGWTVRLGAGFLVPMKVVTIFCSLEMVTFSKPETRKRYHFCNTGQKRDSSLLYKTGGKRDKLEKPEKKGDKRPKIPYSAGKQKPGRKREESKPV
jgi:hypothetical protein